MCDSVKLYAWMDMVPHGHGHPPPGKYSLHVASKRLYKTTNESLQLNLGSQLHLNNVHDYLFPTVSVVRLGSRCRYMTKEVSGSVRHQTIPITDNHI